jgi:hypothetical protein
MPSHDIKRLTFLSNQYRKACELVIATEQATINDLYAKDIWASIYSREVIEAAEARIRSYKSKLARC